MATTMIRHAAIGDMIATVITSDSYRGFIATFQVYTFAHGEDQFGYLETETSYGDEAGAVAAYNEWYNTHKQGSAS